MLTISPQPCSLGWILDDQPMMSLHDQDNYNMMMINNSSFCRDQTSESIIDQDNNNNSPSSRTPNNGGESGNDFRGTKKLNHNACERDRRKRINTLYADLRNLLPQDDHSRKLSIPATISRVLKYIPELQKQVQRLIHNKETLISKAQHEQESSSFKFNQHKINPTEYSYNSAVSTTRISDGEIIIQSSIPKSEKASFSEAISRLEDEGFLIINASCFQSFEGRLFYNFHLQAEEGQVIDAEKLKDKVWPLN